jgi:predicted ATPase
LEGSTRLWEEHPEGMRDALARHDTFVRGAVESHGGHVVKGGGDGGLAVFGAVGDALRAAVALQLAMATEVWGATGPLRVRIGIHTGEAQCRDSDYFGPAVNRTARLMAIGHGGQILVSQATTDLARDALVGDLKLIDLAEHRLRDLSRPERVFQLCHPSLPESFPALRSLENYATNLPLQITEFVGRERELLETATALLEHRIVTLTGVGGVGKTRLALQVSAEVLPEFRDGVFVVELGGVSDAVAVDESVAAALLVQQQAGQTINESLLSFLGNKQLLLMLDNCEHLLEPAAYLVSRMLAAGPDVRVLATSREALRIDGEQVVTVPSLTLPEDSATPELVVATEAVRLFADRAHAIRSDFALTSENAESVGQLCRRLDGVPLAIELAAARVRSMAPKEIAERLDQRFRLLTGGARTAASRHQTLRAAIDWSYEALEPIERELLGRLAVCLGGFDLAAAEAIGTGGLADALDVDDALGRLVDKSLVLAPVCEGTTRYKMLETIREYALERLETTNVMADVRTRHAVHYTAFAEQASVGLKGPQERAWLARIEDELDNLRATVIWSLTSGNTHLACACVGALGLQGLRIEPAVSAWADSVVECDAAQGDVAYPVALAVAGYAKMAEGRIDDVFWLCSAALAHLEITPAPPTVTCRVMSCVAATEPVRGTNPIEHARQWAQAAEAASDDYEAALALNLLAVGQNMAGDPAAHDTAERSLRLARQCGSPSAIAYCLFTTAMVDAPTDPARALSLLDESLRSAEAAANTFAAFTAAGIRNALLIQSGQYDAAARAYLDAAQRASVYERLDQQIPMLFQLAACLAAQRRPEPAAVIVGWARSFVGSVPLIAGALYTESNQWIEDLPEVLGADRYATLYARGAAMNGTEILDYAHRETTTGHAHASPEHL